MSSATRAGSTRRAGKVPWTDALLSAIAAVSWALIGMAGTAALGLHLLQADTAGSLGPMTAAVVALGAGGSVTPSGDVSAFGLKGAEAHTAIEITPLGVSLVGALLLSWFFLRSLRTAGVVIAPAELLARAGTMTVLFVAMLGGLAWAGHDVITIDGGSLGAGALPGAGGKGSGGLSLPGLGDVSGLLPDRIGGLIHAKAGVGFTVDTPATLLGGLGWCAGVLLIALLAGRRAPLPPGWSAVHRVVRPAVSALVTVLLLAVAAGLAAAAYAAIGDDHPRRIAGAALLGAPDGVWLGLPLGLFVPWDGHATGLLRTVLPHPLDQLIGTSSDRPVTVRRLADLDNRVWLLTVAAALAMLLAGVLTAARTAVVRGSSRSAVGRGAAGRGVRGPHGAVGRGGRRLGSALSRRVRPGDTARGYEVRPPDSTRGDEARPQGNRPGRGVRPPDTALGREVRPPDSTRGDEARPQGNRPGRGVRPPDAALGREVRPPDTALGLAVRCAVRLGIVTALALPLLVRLADVSVTASLSVLGFDAFGAGVVLHGHLGSALLLGAVWGAGAGAVGALLAWATGAAGSSAVWAARGAPAGVAVDRAEDEEGAGAVYGPGRGSAAETHGSAAEASGYGGAAGPAPYGGPGAGGSGAGGSGAAGSGRPGHGGGAGPYAPGAPYRPPNPDTNPYLKVPEEPRGEPEDARPPGSRDDVYGAPTVAGPLDGAPPPPRRRPPARPGDRSRRPDGPEWPPPPPPPPPPTAPPGKPKRRG
ncbi:streptophobe family protein [Streptomyces camelliae]|uniref:Streptophobe family protein n=1 Tax=Streptomyces camelliae TaxID=3004093 RepID=A0ABY7PEE6_9ACTN|nr:streptophobe family protein [Streptomyces sp. HUAS 2-6]WBO67211.1 streptophobe family protein [Streptomyces sp. HUAS 2-6]